MNTKRMIFGLLTCLMIFAVTATSFTIGEDEPGIEKRTLKPPSSKK